MLIRQPDGTTTDLRARWSDEGVELVGEGISVHGERVRYDNGETDDHGTLGNAARALDADGRVLIACASCRCFQFSGMSRQMSGGATGYCHLAGFRKRGATVGITWRCGEHRLLEDWLDPDAWDPDAAFERRKDNLRDGRRSAFRGAIVGSAVGDALGFPCEFRSADEIEQAFPGGVTDFVGINDARWGDYRGVLMPHPPGTYSDDTQMSLAIGEALAGTDDSADLEAVMAAISARFVDWSASEDNDRAPGATCMTGCSRLSQGVPWRQAGVADSKGAGAPMRIAPIGLVYHDDRERLLEVARASSLPTHGHVSAVESAAAAALMISLALDKQSPREMRENIAEECGRGAPELGGRLSLLTTLVDAPARTVLSAEGLGESWVAEEAVASALWCFWQSPADFERTVLTAANTTGDSDTIATIAGAISGAFNGIDAIPARWRDRVENHDRLLDMADRLWSRHQAHQAARRAKS